MAVDLSVGFSINNGRPLITSAETDLQVTFTVANSGTTATPAAVTAELFLSADRKLDAKDLSIANSSVAAGLVGRRPVTQKAGLTSATTPTPGRYYLIAAVDRAGAAGRDRVPGNNAIVGRRPQVTLVPPLEIVEEDGTRFVFVEGTSRSDKVGIILSGDQLVIGLNGVLGAAPRVAVDAIGATLGNGNDRLACNTDVDVSLAVVGGLGNDRISGSAATDLINGEAGSDLLFGGGGADVIAGDAGNDRIFGGAGADNMTGGDGLDRFFGNLGDDANDTLDGGGGTDQYDGKDPLDVLASVEKLI
jgi:hypothetical protein